MHPGDYLAQYHVIARAWMLYRVVRPGYRHYATSARTLPALLAAAPPAAPLVILPAPAQATSAPAALAE